MKSKIVNVVSIDFHQFSSIISIVIGRRPNNDFRYFLRCAQVLVLLKFFPS